MTKTQMKRKKTSDMTECVFLISWMKPFKAQYTVPSEMKK